VCVANHTTDIDFMHSLCAGETVFLSFTSPVTIRLCHWNNLQNFIH